MRRQAGKDGSQIAGMLNSRAGSHFHRHAQLISNNISQSGFAQARRAVKQNVIQSLATCAGRLNKYLHILFHALLPNIIAKPLRPKIGLHSRVFWISLCRRHSI